MAFLNSGLNRIRDLTYDDIYAGVAGTGTTAVSFSDTALVSEVAAAEDTSLTISKSDRTLTLNHFIASTSANGNTFYEWGTEMNAGSTLAIRTLTAGVAKTSAIEVTRITLLYFDRD